jgi:hypothetical protein
MMLRRTCCAVGAIVVLACASARADDVEEVTKQARDEFLRGTDAVTHAQWAEALAAFERSAKLKPHAVTTYNIGACERALGHYTRARRSLRGALAENDAAQGAQLAESSVVEAKSYLAQIESLLVAIDITLSPATAALAVDGGPLEAAPSGELVAGLRSGGAAETPPAAKFTLVMDPGAHVLTLSRRGYTDAIVNRTFAPGTKTSITIELDKLPTIFHVDADQASAVVKFAGIDVGTVPVDITRSAGSYRVEVNKPGFSSYGATVVGAPGDRVSLRARMTAAKPSIFTRWWFWTIAATVVGGAAVTTYFLVRQPPPPNGGGLGWSVPIPPSP